MKATIERGDICIGIEFGSTRIKAVVTDENGKILASGSTIWENKFENGAWIYTKEQIHSGLRLCYSELLKNVREKYNTVIKKVKTICISGMMHGYIALDTDKNIIAPFYTWRNNITSKEADFLTGLFDFNIPQRWTVAHLLREAENKESYLDKTDYLTTLSGYIHYLLTGEKIIGICEASGMFPIDIQTLTFNKEMEDRFNIILRNKGYNLKIENILPKVKCAGEFAGTLTKEGAALIDVSGSLEEGASLCPPEGDAGTGMVATNCVKKRTGNVSAGTSVFATLVLEKELSRVYKEFDILCSPNGRSAAMVHSNNCTSEINSWIALFKEVLSEFDTHPDEALIYEKLFKKAYTGDADCGGLMAYCFHSGEHLLNLSKGCPMFMHPRGSEFNLANFMRVQIYTAFAVLKSGLDFLGEKESVKIDKITAHGGIFKTKRISQEILSSAIGSPVEVNSFAGEGGAWGAAVLAAYCGKSKDMSLEDFLDLLVFKNSDTYITTPDENTQKGYNEFINNFNKYLKAEYDCVE